MTFAAILELIWGFAKAWLKPPLLYVLLAAVFIVWILLYGHREYNRGHEDAEMASVAAMADFADRSSKLAAAKQAERDRVTIAANQRDSYQAGFTAGAKAALPKQVAHYVPPKIADLCLPNGIVKLLDAKGLGVADPDALPGAADEPDEACSGISMSKAVALLGANAIDGADIRGRLIEGRGWALDQIALNPPSAAK